MMLQKTLLPLVFEGTASILLGRSVGRVPAALPAPAFRRAASLLRASSSTSTVIYYGAQPVLGPELVGMVAPPDKNMHILTFPLSSGTPPVPCKIVEAWRVSPHRPDPTRVLAHVPPPPPHAFWRGPLKMVEARFEAAPQNFRDFRGMRCGGLWSCFKLPGSSQKSSWNQEVPGSIPGPGPFVKDPGLTQGES